MSNTAQRLTPPTITRLREALDPPRRRLLAASVDAATTAGAELWAVGGAVRDCAAGLPVRDLDLAASGDAAGLAAEVARRTGGTSKVRAPWFGTAVAAIPGARVDFAPLRTEAYPEPGALPVVTLGATIDEDLARRDYSVNAIALGLAGPRRGELLDPHGGLEDLAARRLRVLHERSFRDDATRLWRGARVAALHHLRPDEATARLIDDGIRWLAPISGDRLWTELRLTAARPRLLGTLRLLDAWGVLRGTHPALHLHPEAERAIRRHRAPVPLEVLTAVLLAPVEERATILARFGPPREVTAAVDDAVALLAAGRRFEGEPSPDDLEPLVRTSEAGRTAARWLDPERQAVLQHALRRWDRTASPLDARALMALGVPPGRDLGRLLDRFRRSRYRDPLTRAQARREVLEWLAAEGLAPRGQRAALDDPGRGRRQA